MDVSIHQENIQFAFCTFSCFYCFFQVKKVNFEKVQTTWEKPSPTLFIYFSILFSLFFYNYSISLIIDICWLCFFVLFCTFLYFLHYSTFGR